jgi:hypothetical protein
MELFDVSMLPVAESGVCVTEEYALGQLYTTESYLGMQVVPKEEKKNQPRSKERGISQKELSRILYLTG